jgi:TonB family protein
MAQPSPDNSRKSRHGTERVPALRWLGLSVLIHLCLLLLLSELVSEGAQQPELNEQQAKDFSIAFTPDQAEKPDEKRDKKDKQAPENKQFINMPPPEEEKTPDKAKYRDQFESEAEKNQVKKSPPGRPTKPTPKPKPTKKPPEPKPRKARKPSKEQKDRPEKKPTKKQTQDEQQAEQLAPMKELVRKNKKEATESDSPDDSEESGEKIADRDPEELFPSLENTSSEFTGPPGERSSDYLKDVPEGQKTLLNRKKSRYWTFFHRIKTQVSQEWVPVEKYRTHDPTGEIYGVKDRYSRLEITLESDGTVRQLYLAKPSGLDFLDDEAIRSIRAAAPFRNPPEGLKNQDGLIRFSFGFYLDLNRGTFRALRFRNR